jgi:hypothetical protein
LRISYTAGFVVVILAPFILYFIRALSLNETFFLIFLLLGAWTIAESFAFTEIIERKRYLISGIILGFLSPSFIIQFTYGVAFIIVGIILAVVIASAWQGRSAVSARAAG